MRESGTRGRGRAYNGGMCGIVGFVKENSLKDLYHGLKTLEYRGYDSAGAAYFDGNKIVIYKRRGRVERLRSFLYAHEANVCMGHTRWATHGAPSKVNAHPHRAGKWAVVHNGIVENYADLRKELERMGRKMTSATDTEVIAHLLDAYAKEEGDAERAIRKTVARLKGNWAVAALWEDAPDRVYLFKKGNPLILGEGEGFGCFASDTPALVRHTRRIYKMKDGEIAVVTKEGCRLLCEEGAIGPAFGETTLLPDEVDKGAYPTYMEKEIAEIPDAMEKTAAYIEGATPKGLWEGVDRVILTGCGTAYHACLYGASLCEGVAAEAVVASEFAERAEVVDGHTLVVAVSQSGETADTLTAVRLAKERGAKVVGVTNVPSSGLTGAVDECLVTRAGAEIAVAATKSYATQLVALRGLLGEDAAADVACAVRAVRETAGRQGALAAVAKRKFDNVFLLSKGRDHATCLEGALKIKEVAYMPCDTCYAGEIKHGPLATVTAKTLVVALATESRYAEKMRSAIAEVRARGAKVLVVSSDEALLRAGDWGFALPAVARAAAPMVAVVPLMYLALRLALERGLDPDKPRNLAKSVTVE